LYHPLATQFDTCLHALTAAAAAAVSAAMQEKLAGLHSLQTLDGAAATAAAQAPRHLALAACRLRVLQLLVLLLLLQTPVQSVLLAAVLPHSLLLLLLHVPSPA
jgi:hypothetical protein